MSYFINPAEEERCVFLTYEGEITADEAAAARSEVNAVLVAKQWNRIVVDVTEWRSVPTALELFEAARKLSSSFAVKTRIALVVRPDQAKHARLIEKVARNDSVFLTYFLDPEKAMAWVMGTLPRHDAHVWHETASDRASGTSSSESQTGSSH